MDHIALPMRSPFGETAGGSRGGVPPRTRAARRHALSHAPSHATSAVTLRRAGGGVSSSGLAQLPRF